jgi:hypothetical protein
MHGNVWEWCWDWDAAYLFELPEARAPLLNPRGPADGSLRVLRRGSFDYNAEHVRCADRLANWPADRGRNWGFRCVRSPADLTANVSNTTRPYPVAMYIRFSQPGVVDRQLIYHGDSRYATELSLGHDIYAFQIADLASTAARRFAMNATGARFLVTPGSTSLVSGAAATAVIVINVQPAGTIRFELDATNPDAPMLTITRQ